MSNLAAVLPAPQARFVVEERAIPTPGPDEIVIRNHAIAVNPVDWKRQDFNFAVPLYPTILGTDIAGVVHTIGSAVTSFQPGDRVLGAAPAMATANPDNGAFQTYTLVPASAATKLPPIFPFTHAATLPTAIATASMALFDVLNLPLPNLPQSTNPTTPNLTSQTGILIWGGASSAGRATIQLARLTGLTVFTTASPQHHTHLLSLGATAVVDYHNSPATVVNELLAAAQRAGVEIRYALDAISSAETLGVVVDVLSKSGSGDGGKKVAHLRPWPEEGQVKLPEGVEEEWVKGHEVWGRRVDLSKWLFGAALGGWLESGEVVPQATRVVEGGVGGLQAALGELKKGVSGEKVVVEV